MIYTHVVRDLKAGVKIPLDSLNDEQTTRLPNT